MSIFKTFRTLPNRTLRLSILSLLCVIGLSYAGGRMTINLITNHAAKAEADRIATHMRLIFDKIESESIWQEPLSANSAAVFKRIRQDSMLKKVERIRGLKIWDNTGKLIWADKPNQVEKTSAEKETKKSPKTSVEFKFESPNHDHSAETHSKDNHIDSLLMETHIPIWREGVDKTKPPNLVAEIYTEPRYLFEQLKNDQNLIWTYSSIVGFGVYLLMLGAMLWTDRHRETAESQAVRLGIANTLAKAVGSTLEPEELFKTIVREIRRAVPCERCSISGVSHDTRENHYWYSESDIKMAKRSADEFAVGEWFYREIYETKQPRNFSDINEVKLSWAKHLYESDIRSLLIVPILQNNRPIAHLSLSDTRVGAFTPEHESLLVSIADHLGLAIWNASQFRTSEERALRFAALNDLSRMIAENLNMEEILENIARASMELTRADKSKLFLFDEAEEIYHLHASYGEIPDEGTLSFKPGQGLTGTVAQTGEALLISDVQDDPRRINIEWTRKYGIHSFISQPIRIRGKTTIIISCFSKKKNFFGEEDLKLLDAFASQAAIAIEKGSLIEETRKHAARQKIAAKIAKAVGSILEPDELFKTIAQEIRRAVPCERCVIGSIYKSKHLNTILHSESDIEADSGGANRLTDWLTREVYEPKKLKFIPDIRGIEDKWFSTRSKEGFRSALFIPILQNEKCIAHLGLASTRLDAFTKDHEKLLTSVAGHLGSAIRNASLFRTSEERALRFAALNEVNQKITKNLDLSEVLDGLAQATLNLIQSDHVRIFLLDESSSQLKLRASSGRIPGPVIGQVSFAPGQGMIGHVFQDGKGIIISDIQKDPRWVNTEWATEQGLHGFIGGPIWRGGKIAGIITALSVSADFFDEEDMELVEALASQASVAIENAGLYEESEKKGARLATLVEVAQRLTRGLDLPNVLTSISEAAATLFGGEAGFRLLTENYLVRAGATPGASEAMKIARIRVGESISGMVAETGEAVITTDFRENPLISMEHRKLIQEDRMGAFMCVPVKLEERVLGTLHIYRERGYVFDKEALRLATSLADQAAVAIENARLHGEAQRGLDFFRSVVDDNADAIMVLDLNRKIIHWNSGAEKLYGYTEEEAVGKSIDIIIPPGERNIDRGEEVYTKGVTFQFEADRLKKDGSLIPASVTISPVKNDKGKVIATSAVHKDLTQQKKADEALRQSEERFRNLVEFAGDAIIVNDFDGNIIDVNQHACDSLGYTREELLNLNIRDLELTYDSSKHAERWKEIIPGEPITVEGIQERKDGTTFPVEVRLGKFEMNGQELIVGLARDMTEHKRAEEKLLRAMGEAEAANAAKSEFLSNMSHELRSPLNSIIGFSDILLRDSNNDLVNHLAPKIRESGKHLTRLIEDILDFDRIETGKVQLELKETSINDLVNAAVISLESRMPEGFTIELDLDFSGEIVFCDSTRIRQVITNLLDNAVKYSPDGGTIIARTQFKSEEIWISIQDSGLGMVQEDMQAIFERFHQLESGYKRRSGGLGIGLSLIRQLVELHGGRIWVESEKDQGSTFTFSLPKTPSLMTEDPSQLETQSDSANEIQEEPWAGRTVLLVDDVEHYHEYMKLLMNSVGRILSAYNGEKGIEMARQERPDIILMDLRMPVLNGFDAITRLKENPETKDIPILALSAQTMEEDKFKSSQIGAEGFISKPIDIDRLRNEMKRAFSQKKNIANL